MHALIVLSDATIGLRWKRRLDDSGVRCTFAKDFSEASRCCLSTNPDVIVLDLALSDGSALALADMAAVRHPDATIIPVSDGTTFADGSVFSVVPNARCIITPSTPEGDVLLYIQHCTANPVAMAAGE